MFKSISLFAVVFLGGSTFAAELNFDFSQTTLGASPTGFVSNVAGVGKPGEWKIVEDEVPAAFEPLSAQAPRTAKRFVLGQVSNDKTDERFPLLLFEREMFSDFTLSTRFKCVSGEVEQMAGIAFRVQDEKNFYVVRASALGNSFRFYKVVNGERSAPIGPQINIPANVWHEMSVECKGNQIRCSLNGKEVFPTLTDNTFSFGKIGFWTKSDSVSYFADTKIIYIPRVPLAQKIIREMMERYPRLIGLKLFAKNEAQEVRVLASSEETHLGEPGAKVEEEVIAKGTPYYAKSKESVSMIMPVRDRNGEVIAALRVILKPFPGQTQENALSRATPIVKQIESRIASQQDLSR